MCVAEECRLGELKEEEGNWEFDSWNGEKWENVVRNVEKSKYSILRNYENIRGKTWDADRCCIKAWWRNNLVERRIVKIRREKWTAKKSDWNCWKRKVKFEMSKW